MPSAPFPRPTARFVFTKCGLVWDEAAPMRAARALVTPESVRDGIEHSLRRLGLDHVDLFQIHWPDDEGNEIEPAWEEMLKLREEGLARAVGVSNFDDPAARALRGARSRGLAAAAVLAHQP